PHRRVFLPQLLRKSVNTPVKLRDLRPCLAHQCHNTEKLYRPRLAFPKHLAFLLVNERVEENTKILSARNAIKNTREKATTRSVLPFASSSQASTRLCSVCRCLAVSILAGGTLAAR
ncbi:MAG: uncharacterized protein A8A55_3440, partial [Amphiamblys sp. WSBS2006]